MNRMNMREAFAKAAGLALLGGSMVLAAELPTAKSIAAEMGAGWNLGNTMELIGVQPIPTKALIDSVKKAGFKTIRFPPPGACTPTRPRT